MGPARIKTKTISVISRALTFIELILVVVIIGILTGIALPRLSRAFNHLRLNNFTSQLQGQVNYWHERAIVERKPLILKIDPANNGYWVQFSDSRDRLNSYQVPSGLNMRADQEQVIFSPDGSIGKISIKIINSDGQEICLTTQGVFGGVKTICAE